LLQAGFRVLKVSPHPQASLKPASQLVIKKACHYFQSLFRLGQLEAIPDGMRQRFKYHQLCVVSFIGVES
jgi:hypothetical protein